MKKNNLKEKPALALLLIFLLSPIFMLIVGYHDKPWSLMGLIPAVAIALGYLLAEVKYTVIALLFLVAIAGLNIAHIVDNRNKETLFIKQELSSTLKGQLSVLDYVYSETEGKPFAINSVTYPLYYNTYWSYHLPWYGIQKYGYLPGWLGGDQIYPYNSLSKAKGDEKYFFMIVDETLAIPEIYKNEGKKWGFKYGKLLSEKLIGGFTVQKYQRF